jgi:hypothetical protein
VVADHRSVIGDVLADLADVVRVHGDRLALDELGRAGGDDDRVGVVGVDDVCISMSSESRCPRPE